MFLYMKANRTAGYSGYVLYSHNVDNHFGAYSAANCVWMIPGTFFDDWDN